MIINILDSNEKLFIKNNILEKEHSSIYNNLKNNILLFTQSSIKTIDKTKQQFYYFINNKYINYIIDEINIYREIQIMYNNNNQAFHQAYYMTLYECIKLFYPFIIQIHNKKYKNYEQIFAIDIINDELIIIYQNIKYIFSKYYILSNITFQYILQKKISHIISNCKLFFFNNFQ
jgi:hypothetical protein